jgi:hypothetical protein
MNLDRVEFELERLSHLPTRTSKRAFWARVDWGTFREKLGRIRHAWQMTGRRGLLLIAIQTLASQPVRISGPPRSTNRSARLDGGRDEPDNRLAMIQ